MDSTVLEREVLCLRPALVLTQDSTMHCNYMVSRLYGSRDSSDLERRPVRSARLGRYSSDWPALLLKAVWYD